jgi:general secretion pathway protein G
MRPAARRRRGFTLIEMIAVLAIVGLLAAAAAPVLERMARREQERALREALRQIRQALDAYRAAADAGRIAHPRDRLPAGWPATLVVLEEGALRVDERGEPLEGRPRQYFLRRLPRDPFAEPGTSAREHWGLRSSASPAEAPQPGDDVFDVYSRSERSGLDGTPLRTW